MWMQMPMHHHLDLLTGLDTYESPPNKNKWVQLRKQNKQEPQGWSYFKRKCYWRVSSGVVCFCLIKLQPGNSVITCDSWPGMGPCSLAPIEMAPVMPRRHTLGPLVFWHRYQSTFFFLLLAAVQSLSDSCCCHLVVDFPCSISSVHLSISGMILL